MSQPLSPLAARLALQVAAARNKRILVAELFTAAQDHDLSLVEDPAARARFRQALDELAGASLVTLPSAADTSFLTAARTLDAMSLTRYGRPQRVDSGDRAWRASQGHRR